MKNKILLVCVLLILSSCGTTKNNVSSGSKIHTSVKLGDNLNVLGGENKLSGERVNGKLKGGGVPNGKPVK